jgi:GDP-mannose transporter
MVRFIGLVLTMISNTDVQVLSSIIAAWADVTTITMEAGVSFNTLESVRGVVYRLNIGYLWMFINCAASAAYVRVLTSVMKKRLLTL